MWVVMKMQHCSVGEEQNQVGVDEDIFVDNEMEDRVLE